MNLSLNSAGIKGFSSIGLAYTCIFMCLYPLAFISFFSMRFLSPSKENCFPNAKGPFPAVTKIYRGDALTFQTLQGTIVNLKSGLSIRGPLIYSLACAGTPGLPGSQYISPAQFC